LTKVPGVMSLSLDVRAYDRGHLDALEEEVKGLARAIEERRGVRIQLGRRTSADVAPSDPELHAELTRAAAAMRVRTMPLASPASHDTATFTAAGVPSCMLFVRNANGSHNPHEAMQISDFLEAVTVLTGWLVRRVTS
jgi:N-carbamoyl-L-amino-acid hydrolase